MNQQSSEFALTAPPSHLFDLETMAESMGLTRQGFHAWHVQPVRIEGRRRLFDFASVLENRLQAAQDDDTPADAEIERLQARCDLLREQIEAQRLRNAEDEREYIPAGGAAAALAALMAGLADVIRKLPGDVRDELPKIEPAEDLIRGQIERAADALRSACIEPPESEPEA